MSRRHFAAGAIMAVAGARLHAQGAPGIEAFLVVDAHSRKVLMASNATRRRPVASLTKIATACVVLDWADATRADLSLRARVPESAAGLQPNPFGFQPGDLISLRDALCCAMMGSDNIAAETLAWHVGADLMNRTGAGARDPGATFVKQMNALADRLGMADTRFTNSHGLDSGKPMPYSSAADIARVTLYGLKKPSLTFYTSQAQRRISFQRAGEEQKFLLKNTNELVSRKGIDGVKTGTTSRAGQCLVLSAQRKPEVIRIAEDNHQVFPRRLVAVLLGAHDRFQQGLWLLDQGWSRYDGWAAAGRPVPDPSELLGEGQR